MHEESLKLYFKRFLCILYNQLSKAKDFNLNKKEIFFILKLPVDSL